MKAFNSGMGRLRDGAIKYGLIGEHDTEDTMVQRIYDAVKAYGGTRAEKKVSAPVEAKSLGGFGTAKQPKS